MSRLATLGLLAALGLLAGCPADPVKPKDPACTLEKPCSNGLVCELGATPDRNACVPCRRDRECVRTEFCHPIELRCRTRPCYGHECGVHDDCALGHFCVQGLCLAGAESDPQGCSVVSCAEGETCNDDQRCNPVNSVCEEDLGCTADRDCTEAERCNVAAGRCEPACTPENALEICGVRRVCSEGRCVDCLKDADCGSGLKCNAATSICESLTSCTADRDCEIPLVCNRLTRECTSQPPPCNSAEDCAPDETCQLSNGKCVIASCVVDRFEPNNAVTEARAIAVGASPNLTLCTGDADFFTLALAAGDRLRVIVDVDPLLRLEVAILSGTGEIVAEGQFAADGTVSVAGNYYVRVRSIDTYIRYGLRLSVSRGVPCEADAEEPNDDFVKARSLGPGDYYQKTLCPRDQDWSVVAVARGQTLDVELLSSPGDGDLDLYVYDADGTRELAHSTTTSERETVSTSAFTGSRVYIRVVGGTASVQNVYDLLVRLRTQ